MVKATQSGEYTEQESQQRFQKLVGIALKTKPKTQKQMGRKGVPAQSKKPAKIKTAVSLSGPTMRKHSTTTTTACADHCAYRE